MKLLVTGGMGFMGSNLVRHVYNKYPSYRLLNFDMLTYAGNTDNLEDIELAESRKEDKERRYTFVQGDIADADAVYEAVRDFAPDVILNFAAESHVDRSLVNADTFVRSNVVGAHRLLDLSRKLGIRFIQISTDEVYGDVPEGYSNEESPLRPSNPYAASKAAADLLTQTYWKTYRAPVLVVRGSNNFGPYQYPEKLIPLAITNIFEKKKVPIHGSGSHVRTWLHVDDFVEGVDLILHKGEVGSVHNLAGHEDTNLNVLKKIAGFLGSSPEESFEFVNDRPGADMRYAPSAGKIKNELGWRPRRNIEEALPDLVSWYRTNEAWWRKVKQRSEFVEHYERQSRARYD